MIGCLSLRHARLPQSHSYCEITRLQSPALKTIPCRSSPFYSQHLATMSTSDSIVKSLREYTSCDISDALVKLKYPHGGFLPGLSLFSPERQSGDTKIVGRAYTVKYVPNDDPTPKHSSHYVRSQMIPSLIIYCSQADGDIDRFRPRRSSSLRILSARGTECCLWRPYVCEG